MSTYYLYVLCVRSTAEILGSTAPSYVMGTGWVLMKWPRNGFVEMGFFEREMEMEMGWRVEQRVGRGSQEQLPRGSTEERGERAGEKRRKKEKGRERRSVEKRRKKERIKKGPDKFFNRMKSYSSSSFVKSYCSI
jgi:hypothetical protein